MQKPPPVYSNELVLHPQRDSSYTLFENARAHPFEPTPDAAVPRVNAWWLAEASLASYWAPPDATAIYASAGLTAQYITAAGTDVYIAWQDAWMLVAFRGTQPDRIEDNLTDAALALVPWSSGHVHCGFKKALDVVWPALIAAIEPLSRERAVWFCGHSLGAALATLAAHRYAGTRGACTFGSPRVGDRAFARAVTDALAGRMLRFVNNHDLVTHVPPPLFGYKHVGPHRLIARDGTISDRQPGIPHFFSDLIGEPRQMSALTGAVAAPASRPAPAFVLDHMPKAYAIRTWNDYDRNGQSGPSR